ncbi:MAG TPA: metalloregulator ArsR/SmtB family transcription factor [Acidimicrobiia bacterium]|nr:metalloregulator ArsR/SmtB family transcription factor [Acidimicrobiia bacterium]
MNIPDVDSTFRALADPTRRRILQLVSSQTLSAGEIANHFRATRPAISQHLGVLRSAGLLSEERKGARRLYRADPEGLADAIEHLQSFWPGRLQALKVEAERKERRQRDQ